MRKVKKKPSASQPTCVSLSPYWIQHMLGPILILIATRAPRPSTISRKRSSCFQAAASIFLWRQGVGWTCEICNLESAFLDDPLHQKRSKHHVLLTCHLVQCGTPHTYPDLGTPPSGYLPNGTRVILADEWAWLTWTLLNKLTEQMIVLLIRDLPPLSFSHRYTFRCIPAWPKSQQCFQSWNIRGHQYVKVETQQVQKKKKKVG